MQVGDFSRIDRNAKIAEDVKIGSFCTVHANVEIHEGTTIEDYCTLGYPTPLAGGKPLVIGRNSLIRSYSLFYEGSSFGEGLSTGNRASVRELTTAGKHFQIGTLCDIQGHCQIGDHVRFQSNVYIAQGSILHDFVWIFPHAVLTNDPHPPNDLVKAGAEIFDHAVISASACVLSGLKIGEHSLVGASSLVTKDVEPHTAVFGVPAKFRCRVEEIMLRDGSNRPAYPWTRHFHRGYPEEIVAKWIKE